MGNLNSSRRHHRKLPAELNCQIYLCFNPATQRKFIWGLGWDFYAMFRHRLLTKTMRVCNPRGNHWKATNTTATIMALNATYKVGPVNIFSVQPFPTSGPHCRMDEFTGTICYYYEVKGQLFMVGLSDGAIPDDDYLWIGEYLNSYAIHRLCSEGWLAGERHQFELPEGAIRLRRFGINVYGCGLVVDPKDKLWIFFTLNGRLIGRKISISPTVDRLFPAVTMMQDEIFEANFGDDPAKPFEYDIKKCYALELACI